MVRDGNSSSFFECFITSQVYALLMVEEMRSDARISTMEEQVSELRFAAQSSALLQEKLASEEDAKRHILIRYINAVKVWATSAAAIQITVIPASSAALKPPPVIISLPKAGVGDEEVP